MYAKHTTIFLSYLRNHRGFIYRHLMFLTKTFTPAGVQFGYPFSITFFSSIFKAAEAQPELFPSAKRSSKLKVLDCQTFFYSFLVC